MTPRPSFQVHLSSISLLIAILMPTLILEPSSVQPVQKYVSPSPLFSLVLADGEESAQMPVGFFFFFFYELMILLRSMGGFYF